MYLKFKNLFLLCVAALTSVILMGSSCFFVNRFEYLTETLEEDWEEQLPDSATLKYRLTNRGGMSDGEEYYVLSLGDDAEDFLKDFSSERDEAFEKSVNQEIEWLIKGAGRELPTEYVLDWEAEYFWKEKTNSYLRHYLYFIYFPQNSELYIVISYT